MYSLECLKFPQFVEDSSLLENHLCYFIEPYDNGELLSIAIKAIGDDYVLKVLDKDGRHLQFADISPVFSKFLSNEALKILCTIRTIGLNICQLFFSVIDDQVILVDLYDGSKFAGPGMLRDIFSKRFRVQKILKIDKYEADGSPTDTIIKPSMFMAIERGGKKAPLYVRN